MGYRMLAALSLRHPRLVILTWALFLIVFGPSASKLPSVVQDHGLIADGSYLQVRDLLSEDSGISGEPVILLFEQEKPVSSGQFRAFIELALRRVRNVDGITAIVSPLDRVEMARKGAAYALLGLRPGSRDIAHTLDDVRRSLPDRPGITARLTGKPVVQADVNRASERDMKRAELFGIPAAFVILLFAFGGVVYAVMPVAIGMIGVAGTMGFMSMIGSRVELSNFVLNVIPMVGLALSVDFALLIVSRFREERSRHGVETAIHITLQTAGRAVVFSGICVFLGLAATLFIGLPMFISTALAAMTVLTVSVLSSLTLLPAVLTMMGASGKVVTSSTSTPAHAGAGGIWPAWSQYVMKRPIRMALLASIVLLVCLLPVRHMKVAIPDAASLPEGYESRRAAEVFEAHFIPPDASIVAVVIRGQSSGFDASNLRSAYEVIRRMEQDPGVMRVDSIFSRLEVNPAELERMMRMPGFAAAAEPALTFLPHDNRLAVNVTIRGAPGSMEASNWVRRWERVGQEGVSHTNVDQTIGDHARLDQAAGVDFLLGGEAKYRQEVADEISHHVWRVLILIGTTNYLALLIAFRSVLIPLKALVMNALSLAASFGILVTIFQEGRFGMEPSAIAIMIPVFIFGMAFGISMDYGVFLLSRISEEYRRTGDTELAVTDGLTTTARIISSAAAIILAVTVPFTFGDVVGVKQLGVGISAAIAIDATVVRLVLVPALMRLLGRYNWWLPWRHMTKQ